MDIPTLRAKYEALSGDLDERRRRLWAAAEAEAAGYGGISMVVRATGISESTVLRGLKELASAHEIEPGRVRRRGAGPKRLSAPLGSPPGTGFSYAVTPSPDRAGPAPWRARPHCVGGATDDPGRSATVLLDRETGKTKRPSWLSTTPSAVETLSREISKDVRVILEAGTHSGWIADVGRRLGVDVFVANPRRLDAVTKIVRKSDEYDAALLAEVGARSLALLRATFVRDRAMQVDLAVIRARDAAGRARLAPVNATLAAPGCGRLARAPARCPPSALGGAAGLGRRGLRCGSERPG